MKIIGLSRLSIYTAAHADCRSWITNWICDIRASSWTNTHDIRAKYPTASFLGANVVIFNVRGNNYRLVTRIAFNTGILSVIWIGNHAEYTQRYS